MDAPIATAAFLAHYARVREDRADVTGLGPIEDRPRLPPLAGQPDQPWLRRQRRPAGDGARALPRLRIVGHAGEQAAQLDRGSVLAATFKGGTDRSGVCLGDNEHTGSMGTSTMVGKAMHGLQPLRERSARCALA
jgi:hypothetical protein